MMVKYLCGIPIERSCWQQISRTCIFKMNVQTNFKWVVYYINYRNDWFNDWLVDWPMKPFNFDWLTDWLIEKWHDHGTSTLLVNHEIWQMWFAILFSQNKYNITSWQCLVYYLHADIRFHWCSFAWCGFLAIQLFIKVSCTSWSKRIISCWDTHKMGQVFCIWWWK